MTELIPFPEVAEPVPELVRFEGPAELVRRGLAVPAGPGVYVIASGDCVSHIGISGNLRSRVGSLAGLGTHRGSAEVICAAHCTGSPPHVWWLGMDRPAASLLEATLKVRYGEPPWPRDIYSGCVNGRQLRDDLVAAAGADSWEAGYAEAVFAIGEKLRLLFDSRFDDVWSRVGVPAGPWRS
jgi:hypothetical protein